MLIFSLDYQFSVQVKGRCNVVGYCITIVIHYYVITYDHVITEMNNENTMCQRESSQFE